MSISRRGVVITLKSRESYSISDHFSQSLPVNVANIEDLTKGAGNLGVGTDELRTNASLSQIGAHGEVSDTGDHGDSSGNVMKETVCARLGER